MASFKLDVAHLDFVKETIDCIKKHIEHAESDEMIAFKKEYLAIFEKHKFTCHYPKKNDN